MIDLPRPISAVWSNKDFDIPIVLTSFGVHEDGQVFFGIEGSKTCIPYVEIGFEKGQDPMDSIIKLLENNLCRRKR